MCFFLNELPTLDTVSSRYVLKTSCLSKIYFTAVITARRIQSKRVKLFASLSAQQAYFYSKLPRGIVKATIGQDFTFDWSLTLEKGDSLILMSPEYSKTEQFDEMSTETMAHIEKSSISIVDAFKGKISVARTGSLTLHNVSVEQQGFYRCVVTLKQQSRSVSIKRQLLVGSKYVFITL